MKTLRTLAAALAGGIALAAPAQADEFTILFWETPADYALRGAATPEGAAYWEAWGAYVGRLGAAGVIRGGAPLGMPAEAIGFDPSGRIEGARANDGLVLGGWFLIEAETLEAAAALAAQAPSVARAGAVEVRATYPAPTMGPAPSPEMAVR